MMDRDESTTPDPRDAVVASARKAVQVLCKDRCDVSLPVLDDDCESCPLYELSADLAALDTVRGTTAKEDRP